MLSAFLAGCCFGTAAYHTGCVCWLLVQPESDLRADLGAAFHHGLLSVAAAVAAAVLFPL